MFAGTPSVRYYNAPPAPAPIYTLSLFPRTISKNETTLLSWDIKFPNESCELTAKVVCKNNRCTAEQTDFENELNQKLSSDFTDLDDPESSRQIPTALKTVAPGHVDDDWKALGKKTLSLLHTTDFNLTCGNGLFDKKRVYIRSGN